MCLIQCHFDYACCVWYYSINNVLKNKLQTTQNKLIRFILDLDSRVHISPEHFKLLNWLPVHSRVEHLTLCHVFKIRNNLSPLYMSDHFISQDTVHSYGTRLNSKGAFVIPRVKSFGSRSFCFNGCKFWNSLPVNFNNIKSLGSFKAELKQHLINCL